MKLFSVYTRINRSSTFFEHLIDNRVAVLCRNLRTLTSFNKTQLIEAASHF